VLEDVWECEQAAFLGDHVPHILHSRTVLLTPEDFRKPIVVVLVIVDITSIGRGLLSEGETTFCYVGTVVVVDRCGTNVLILSQGVRQK
jgi:hypothetical protein